MQEARRMVKESQVDDRGVAAELQDRNLPNMRKQLMTLIFGLPSLARLNRERIKLERELGDLSS
jgi:hypothetical protein